MDKCITCQHYDRKNASPTEARGLNWGQCRRSAPMLNPVSGKSYMIEGVWPTVRDDDWCGEFKGAARRGDLRLPEPLSAGMASSASPSPRIGPLSALTSVVSMIGASSAAQPMSSSSATVTEIRS